MSCSDTKDSDNNLNGPQPAPPTDLETAKEPNVEKKSEEMPKKPEEEAAKKEEPVKKEEPLKPPTDTNNNNKTLEKKKSSSSKRKSKKSKKGKKGLTRSGRQRLSIRRTMRENPANDLKATLLTFQAVRNKTDQARVQLLLCNISDRDIFVKLRCNSNSNVTAVPASSGHISPKSQMRILLNWKKPDGVSQWSDLPMPKILLTTYFLQQGEKSSDEAPTNTRLMARVSSSKQCDPDNSPIEQLLLDAIGKDAGVTGATASTPNTAIPPAMTPNEVTPEKLTKKELEEDEEADNLRWIIIALVFVIVMLLLQKQ